MTPQKLQPIVEGLSLDLTTGQASVDAALTETLLDLAEALGDMTRLPVDIEHVVAAVILAARDGQLSPQTQLAADNLQQRALLIPPLRTIFHQYHGRLGDED